MENKTIQPINENIKSEENPSFANRETQEQARSVYPVDTKSTIYLEDAIHEQTAEVRKINSRLTLVIFLLAIPYIISITLLVLITIFGYSLTNSLKTYNSSSYHSQQN